MKLTHQNTIIYLYILTVIMALASHYLYGISIFVTLILGLSSIKFMLVAFQFMEMKKANGFWKFFIVFYLVIFVSAVSLLIK
jgi:heme/copper-type cytochrome/quinol oxidase subunit 4